MRHPGKAERRPGRISDAICPDGMAAGDFRMRGHPGVMAAKEFRMLGGTPGCNGGGGIPDAGGRPGVMAMEEFRIQGDVRVEWRREEFWMRYVRME